MSSWFCSLKDVQFSQQLHLLNFIFLHCINLKIVTFGKTQCEQFICPKAHFSFYFCVMFLSHYVVRVFFSLSFVAVFKPLPSFPLNLHCLRFLVSLSFSFFPPSLLGPQICWHLLITALLLEKLSCRSINEYTLDSPAKEKEWKRTVLYGCHIISSKLLETILLDKLFTEDELEAFEDDIGSSKYPQIKRFKISIKYPWQNRIRYNFNHGKLSLFLFLLFPPYFNEKHVA